VAQGTVYCAEHVPAAGAPSYTATASAGPWVLTPHPGVAFVLGFIPGVGAIYNGQYAKGLVHAIIFGLLVSILAANAAEGLEPLVGIMLAAFCAYMPFEAYHTARPPEPGRTGGRGFRASSSGGHHSSGGAVTLIIVGRGVSVEYAGDFSAAPYPAILAGAADRARSEYAVLADVGRGAGARPTENDGAASGGQS